MVQCYDMGHIVTAERSEGCNYVDVRSKAKPVESMERRLAAPERGWISELSQFIFRRVLISSIMYHI